MLNPNRFRNPTTLNVFTLMNFTFGTDFRVNAAD